MKPWLGFAATTITLLLAAPAAQAAAPANDNFASATAIPAPGTPPAGIDGTNVEATGEAGEPLHENNSANPAIQSVWYRWTAPAGGGEFVIDTCRTTSNFDTAIAIYTGVSFAAPLVERAKNDDRCDLQSGVVLDAVAGTTYSIAVEGFGTDTGTFNLRLRAKNTPNDPFAAPVVLNGATPQATGLTIGASAETGEPSHAGEAANSSLWYSWAPATPGEYTVSVCANFINRLAIYTGTSLATLVKREAVASPPAMVGGCFRAQVELSAQAGQTYLIAVDGRIGNAGDFDLLIGAAPAPPPNDNLADAEPLVLGTAASGTNVGATRELGEPDHNANSAGHSVWYSWLAPDADRVAVDSCASTIAAVSAVYTGSAANALTPVVEGEDCAEVAWVPTPGITYKIVIDAQADDLSGDTGDVSVRVIDKPLPPTPPVTPPVTPPTTPPGPGPDATAPIVKVDSGPKKRTTKTSAKLAFSANEAAKFECRLTGKKAKPALAKFTPCISATSYRKLKPGKYKFEVRGYDASANVSAPASWSWKVIART